MTPLRSWASESPVERQRLVCAAAVPPTTKLLRRIRVLSALVVVAMGFSIGIGITLFTPPQRPPAPPVDAGAGGDQ